MLTSHERAEHSRISGELVQEGLWLHDELARILGGRPDDGHLDIVGRGYVIEAKAKPSTMNAVALEGQMQRLIERKKENPRMDVRLVFTRERVPRQVISGVVVCDVVVALREKLGIRTEREACALWNPVLEHCGHAPLPPLFPRGLQIKEGK